MQQLTLFDLKPQLCFGGSLNKGRRKSRRPLSLRRPIHIVMRADRSVLRRNERLVRGVWNRMAKRFGIKTYASAVNSNHLHFVIRIQSRGMYAKFVQAFCGTLSLKLGIEWLFRPFTRIANWGRSFKNLKLYIRRNEMEAAGLIPYRIRTPYLSRTAGGMLKS
jgi:REP element-mobilizing transposase RayT